MSAAPDLPFCALFFHPCPKRLHQPWGPFKPYSGVQVLVLPLMALQAPVSLDITGAVTALSLGSCNGDQAIVRAHSMGTREESRSLLLSAEGSLKGRRSGLGTDLPQVSAHQSSPCKGTRLPFPRRKSEPGTNFPFAVGSGSNAWLWPAGACLPPQSHLRPLLPDFSGSRSLQWAETPSSGGLLLPPYHHLNSLRPQPQFYFLVTDIPLIHTQIHTASLSLHLVSMSGISR